MHATQRVERIRVSARKGVRIVTLVTTFCAVTLIGVAAEQVTEKRIGRFGSIGRELSALEIAHITDLANAEGKAPWLILGFRSMILGVTTLKVYLEPDVTTEGLNRGRILHLAADDAPRVAQRSRWTVLNKASYAHVPLGGKPREIADERHLGWPFAVAGDIDDETLISLVTFIRSRPAIPSVPEGFLRKDVASGKFDPVGGNAGLFKVDSSERLKGLLRHPGADKEMSEITVADVASRLKAARR
jgi:hypothetical protein